jgi:hypothetical protein
VHKLWYTLYQVNFFSGDCPDGWDNLYDGKCYFISQDKYIWSDARDICNNRGGRFAFSTSAGVNNHIKGIITRQNTTIIRWIGLKRDQSGVFKWTDSDDNLQGKVCYKNFSGSVARKNLQMNSLATRPA